MRDPFQAYMDEISRTELLDQAAVIALAEKIKAGARVEAVQRTLAREAGRRPTLPEMAARLRLDEAAVQRAVNAGTVAKNDLVAANLRLVASVARQVQASKTGTAGLALDDMIQEGSVGLIRAAEKYDAARGYRFSTYATWWVRASVLRAITTQSRPIKVPSSIVEDYARIEKERARQVAAGARAPDDDAVAAAIGMTRAKLRFVAGVVTRRTASLDVPLGVGSALEVKSLGELIPGADDVEERMVEEMQRRELDAVLRASLKPMERAAVRLRFGLEDGHPRTLLEIGALMSVSKERVRQLVFAALSKLKTPEVRQFLQDYLS
jgi:RNA polymerase primary sigma factor